MNLKLDFAAFERWDSSFDSVGFVGLALNF